jgi:hypothetical protein
LHDEQISEWYVTGVENTHALKQGSKDEQITKQNKIKRERFTQVNLYAPDERREMLFGLLLVQNA